jgi:hypothetical protein
MSMSTQRVAASVGHNGNCPIAAIRLRQDFRVFVVGDMGHPVNSVLVTVKEELRRAESAPDFNPLSMFKTPELALWFATVPCFPS